LKNRKPGSVGYINLRQVHLGYLSKESTLALLRSPIPEFPADAVPATVAERIFARCGGQPFLTQLYGSLLVNHLNDGGRQQADPSDVTVVEDQVLEQASPYFRNITSRMPDNEAETVAEALGVLQAGGSRHAVASLPTAARDWLRQRGLITRDGDPSTPVLGRWLEGMNS